MNIFLTACKVLCSQGLGSVQKARDEIGDKIRTV